MEVPKKNISLVNLTKFIKYSNYIIVTLKKIVSIDSTSIPKQPFYFKICVYFLSENIPLIFCVIVDNQFESVNFVDRNDNFNREHLFPHYYFL